MTNMREKPMSTLDDLFLNASVESWVEYRQAMSHAQQAIYEQFASLPQPFSGMGMDELASRLEQMEVCPEEAQELTEIIDDVGKAILAHSVAVHHPACSAHLHCPPLIPSLAAEAMISASNQSMDSWDQSPAATLVEEKLIRWLCQLFGYPEEAGGVFTSGGTQSNFTALLLARDQVLNERFGWPVKQRGLPPEARKLRILCAKTAHFTIKQSAALLGLGEEAVVSIEPDDQMRLSIDDLDQRLTELTAEGLLPFCLVATAGSTDFGAIDPIGECISRAQRFGLWLHVDAAYGGAVMLSERHKHLLAGVEQADSITVDFHKLFYQPISCGAFLTKQAGHFGLMKLNADYLNPEEDEVRGIPNLVSKSVQTTRRFDALKLLISMRALGRKRFASLIDHTIELAQQTAQLINQDPQLELIHHQPQLNAVVFRYVAQHQPEPIINQLNQSIRHALLQSGQAVLAQTKVDGKHCLKLTLLNPRTTAEEVALILDQVKQIGSSLELQERGEQKACPKTPLNELA